MIRFLDTSGIVHRVESIAQTAEEYLILVSPYLQLSKRIEERIHDASSRGVAVKFVYGKESRLNENEYGFLKSLSDVEVYFHENLHAKCYFSEKELVLASMNLYEFSQQNREMGVSVTADEQVYKEAKQEVEQIIRHSEKRRMGRGAKRAISGFAASVVKAVRSASGPSAYCIRCGEGVPSNPDRPLCGSCFSSWSRYSNPDFTEKRCHACGKSAKTSLNKPVCYPCYTSG